MESIIVTSFEIGFQIIGTKLKLCVFCYLSLDSFCIVSNPMKNTTNLRIFFILLFCFSLRWNCCKCFLWIKRLVFMLWWCKRWWVSLSLSLSTFLSFFSCNLLRSFFFLVDWRWLLRNYHHSFSGRIWSRSLLSSLPQGKSFLYSQVGQSLGEEDFFGSNLSSVWWIICFYNWRCS